MKQIHLSEIKDLVEYEKARDAMRASVIELKRNRRVAVGDNLTFLFENRATVLFQIQEMVRTERIVDEARIQEEIDAYNALIPGPGELSATLFIEIPELARMSNDEVRRTINRFQGLDRGGVTLRLGDRPPIPARFEEGHSKEEKMAAVHYLRFSVPREAQAALADPRQTARLVVDHPSHRAEAEIPPATRAELLADLRA
jgi:choline dehydrogenase-like flavoprotein